MYLKAIQRSVVFSFQCLRCYLVVVLSVYQNKWVSSGAIFS